MKKVEAWQTTDYQIFHSEAAAKQHQNKLDFLDWYKQNELWDDWSDALEGLAVYEYIIKYKEQVLKLLSE